MGAIRGWLLSLDLFQPSTRQERQHRRSSNNLKEEETLFILFYSGFFSFLLFSLNMSEPNVHTEYNTSYTVYKWLHSLSSICIFFFLKINNIFSSFFFFVVNFKLNSILKTDFFRWFIQKRDNWLRYIWRCCCIKMYLIMLRSTRRQSHGAWDTMWNVSHIIR